jgi:hypothetical protein
LKKLSKENINEIVTEIKIIIVIRRNIKLNYDQAAAAEPRKQPIDLLQRTLKTAE